MASVGERTCEVCGGLDCQRFKLADKQFGVNFPPVHPNCRCTTIAYDPDDERPELEGSQEQLSYDEWRDRYVEGREQPRIDSREGAEIGLPANEPVPVLSGGNVNTAVQTLTTGEDSGIIERDDIFIHPDKINKFCLDPQGKHADDFFNVGYKPGDYEALYRDLIRGFDESKIVDTINPGDDVERFSVFMELGVDKKKRFRTVWQKDTPDSKPRFITAHRED